MKTRYYLTEDPLRLADGDVYRASGFVVVDRRDPTRAVCWCADVNSATKITTALNQQFREGTQRRLDLRRHA